MSDVTCWPGCARAAGRRPARPTAAARSPTSTTAGSPRPTSWAARRSRRTPSSNGLDPTAFPTLLRMENALVGVAARPARRAGRPRSARSPPAAPSRSCSRCRPPATPAPTSSRPTHGAAEHRARRVPQGRALLRRAAGARRRSARTSAPTRSRWPRRSTTRRRARRGQRAVVRPRRGRPGHRDRRGRGRARGPLPRRRLHRRLDAAVRRAPRPRRAAVDFAVDGVTSISVDLHKYAYTPKGASLLLHRTAGAAPAAVLRQRRLARLHDAQLDDAVHQVRRSARGRVGGGPTRSATTATSRLTEQVLDGMDRLLAGRREIPALHVVAAARLDAGRARRPTAPATCSRSPTRCPRPAGTSSRSCPSPAARPRCT